MVTVSKISFIPNNLSYILQMFIKNNLKYTLCIFIICGHIQLSFFQSYHTSLYC